MPTPKKGPRLGGSPAHERLILSNLATSLFEHGAITTTAAKAKRLQPLAESMITKAKRGDLNSRRGHIQGMEMRAGAQVVKAFVPLAAMFGYATDLRSETQGRATYSMQFDHYAPLPPSLAQEMIAKARRD